jgi:hypothetical protein
MRAAARAYEFGFDAPPVLLRSGGTIPAVRMLRDTLQVPVVMMGFALPDDPDACGEREVPSPVFYRGIATSIAFLSLAASVQRFSAYAGTPTWSTSASCCGAWPFVDTSGSERSSSRTRNAGRSGNVRRSSGIDTL